MPEIGHTISHYRIIEKLGQGGMGEVFLAHDTDLDRKVALKFLPDIFSGDPERLARFEREAKLLASLNHPNIATIYGLELADGKRFLAMELVEGETLAERIGKGPLPVEETIAVCRQIAEGLEAAHERGVIHRDLKPANVKITPEGKAKILDFGLAKAFQGEPSAADASKSPTLTDQMTRPGVILGTAAYMAPEQAKGKAVDKRADIWAFGCVLYECLTGKKAFQGDTITETVAAILKSEPDWTLILAETSFSVRAVLRRCLQKDPSLRLRDIGDARMEMQDVAPGGSEIHSVVASTPGRWRLFPWIVTFLALFVAFAFAIRSVRQPERIAFPVRRFVISLPEPLTDHWRPNLALSPDGTQLAYGAGFGRVNAHLYHRSLNELEFKPISGTEGGHSPFFSLDGKWIGFFTEGRLKKVPVAGGPVVNLAEIGDSYPSGGIYEKDESILFQLGWSAGIARISALATGTMPQTLFTPDRKQNERGLLWPQRLPGDDLVLFTSYAGNSASKNDARVVIGHLDDQSKRTVLAGGTYARYLPTGHLLYGYDGKLMAAPLDLANPKRAENAVPVLEGILMNTASGTPQFTVSDTGDLVYIPGSTNIERDSFVLVDRNATREAIDPPGNKNESRFMSCPNISPDGLRIAVHMPKSNDDIHIYDFSRGSLTRATFEDGDEMAPVWTPDSTKIAYTSDSGPIPQMFLKSINGSSPPEPIFEGKYPRYPCSFSPDGKMLAFEENHPKTGWDIWAGITGGKEDPRPFLRTEHSESSPAFSPDGQWMAYQSDKSGQMQVYVTSFPDRRDEKQISLDGGTEPRWNPIGNELFYLNDNRFMAVAISFKPIFRAAKPTVLFTTDENFWRRDVLLLTSYSVMPDGQKFVFIKQTQVNPANQCIFIQNWFEELKSKVPAGRK
ncbi:MAG: protein kinase [Acidobacteriia bacterium]|nr:protein kinase [Terriglobia bacterium]